MFGSDKAVVIRLVHRVELSEPFTRVMVVPGGAPLATICRSKFASSPTDVRAPVMLLNVIVGSASISRKTDVEK